MDRAHMLVRNLDHSWMRGVEIGPWYSPVAPKAGGWRTIVVDFTDAQALRRIAEEHSAVSIRNAAGAIEDVDVVWRGQPLDEECLRHAPDGCDYLIASHVIEHIPDYLRFLEQADRFMVKDGLISIALPDMRYCFDFFKPLTTTADVLGAYRERRSRHAPETIFVANAYQSWGNGAGAWLRNTRPDIKLICPLETAYAVYQQQTEAIDNPNALYVDAHCWIFTPSSFRLLMLELHSLSLTPFEVTNIVDGEGGEFFVQLRRNSEVLSSSELQNARESLMKSVVLESASRLSQFQSE